MRIEFIFASPTSASFPGCTLKVTESKNAALDKRELSRRRFLFVVIGLVQLRLKSGYLDSTFANLGIALLSFGPLPSGPLQSSHQSFEDILLCFPFYGS